MVRQRRTFTHDWNSFLGKILFLEQNVVFQKYENTQYHKVLITKHNSLIYTIEKDILKIHRILQNFQNPDENYKNITEK